jgi:OmpA-OmpF porin, OOP family
MKIVTMRTASAVAATVATLCMAAPSLGATPGLYVVADLGTTSFDFTHSEADDLALFAVEEAGLDVVDAESSLDKSGFGYSLGLGYQFTPHFAVEASYVDLGKAKYQASGTVSDGSNTYDMELGMALKSSGPAVALIGSLPINDAFSIDARAGAYFAKTKVTVSASIEGTRDSMSDSDTDTSIQLGIGGTWTVAERLGVRFGYTHFLDGVASERDVGQFSVGLKFSF